MSLSGLEVFDKTVQTTNTWLHEIGEAIGGDRRKSYEALRAVSLTLRDRLTVDEAAHLAAQLPMLIRGIYYEGYRPAGKPERLRSRGQFLQKVSEHLGKAELPADEAVRAVLKVLQKHVANGEIEDVKRSLPQEIQSLFPSSAEVN
jgi:uncharacterized protein (DUF2267 family)